MSQVYFPSDFSSMFIPQKIWFTVSPLKKVLSNQIGNLGIPSALIRRKGKEKKKLNMACTSVQEGETKGTAIENPKTGKLKAVPLQPLMYK